MHAARRWNIGVCVSKIELIARYKNTFSLSGTHHILTVDHLSFREAAGAITHPTQEQYDYLSGIAEMQRTALRY